MRLVLILLCGAAFLAGADLSGRWTGKFGLPGSPPFHVELKQTGDRIIGYGGARADFLTELTNVQLTGASLTFDLRMPMGPSAHFEAAVEGERIAGTLAFPGSTERPKFELTRSGPLARLPESLAPPPNIDDLAPLTDEFNSTETLVNWKSLSLEESLPNRIARIDVNKTRPGSLFIEPHSGAWWAGFHGGYLFKEIAGDFAVTARMKVTGKSGGEPENIWTLSGLLVRAPGDLNRPLPLRKENWLYLMTGRGPRAARVVDSKSTVDSVNEWDILPAETAWYELRIVRMGPLFVSFARPDGGAWTVRKRMLRPDLPRTLQAGINVTSDFKTSESMPAAEYNARLYPDRSKADSNTVVDFVRFSRIGGGAELRAALANRAPIEISDEQLLKLFRP